MSADLSEYFSGQKLYGDNFSLEELKTWYEVEKEGYAGEVLSRNESYQYKYHELNAFYGFRHINLKKNSNALGLGSAYGTEFQPITPFLEHIIIIDPSDEFESYKVDNISLEYRKPAIDGTMGFADNTFDLITCFGVLHHIANVTKVLTECYRCLAPGGTMLCREPIVTMGDWRRPRKGLTKNERGIPIELFKKMVIDSGFIIVRAALFDFPPFVRVMDKIGVPVFSNRLTTRLDYLFSLLFSFNTKYHRTNTIEKVGPASLFIVLRKPDHTKKGS